MKEDEYEALAVLLGWEKAFPDETWLDKLAKDKDRERIPYLHCYPDYSIWLAAGGQIVRARTARNAVEYDTTDATPPRAVAAVSATDL